MNAVSANPADRKYSKTHEWFKTDGDTVTIGITKFAADQLTDITFVDLPAVGAKVSAGTAFGEIESVKATGELVSYVTGEVIEVNVALADEPGLVNTDSFGGGWMIKVRVSDAAGLEELMDSAAYDAMLQEG